MPAPAEMHDHVYKILELVGSSEKSIEDAIQNAITRASKTIRFMKWFEVVQTRGHIEEGSVRHYQVTLPGQHELALALPWGGTSHPVWFKRDPRVANVFGSAA